MAAMSSVSRTEPARLVSIVKPTGEGKFAVEFADTTRETLFRTSAPETTTSVPATNVVPQYRGSDGAWHPVYAQSSGGTWPQVIEQAYATAFGEGRGYEGLKSTDGGLALSRLTGRQTYSTEAGAWKNLLWAKERNQPVIIASKAWPKLTHAKPRPDIVRHHWYSLIDLWGEGNKRRVVLANPHAGSPAIELTYDELYEYFDKAEFTVPKPRQTPWPQ
jgi:hypothetical protein